MYLDYTIKLGQPSAATVSVSLAPRSEAWLGAISRACLNAVQSAAALIDLT